MSGTLVLVRHGQSEWNLKNLFTGWRDPDLSELGIAEARAYEKKPGVYAVSINSGFGNADIKEVGPTVLVTCEGDVKAHQAFAESIADDIWEKRFDVLNRYYTVEEAAAIARDYRRGKGPIIVADYADNPGGGGYGDSTELLRAMLAAGLKDARLHREARPARGARRADGLGRLLHAGAPLDRCRLRRPER